MFILCPSHLQLWNVPNQNHCKYLFTSQEKLCLLSHTAVTCTNHCVKWWHVCFVLFRTRSVNFAKTAIFLSTNYTIACFWSTILLADIRCVVLRSLARKKKKYPSPKYTFRIRKCALIRLLKSPLVLADVLWGGKIAWRAKRVSAKKANLNEAVLKELWVAFSEIDSKES